MAAKRRKDPDNDPDTLDDKDPVDKDDDRLDDGDLAKLVNSAVTTRVKRLGDRLLIKLTETLEAQSEALTAQLEEMRGDARGGRDPSPPPSSGPGAGDVDKLVADRLAQVEAKYEKRIKELEAKAEKERQERQQEQEARMQQEERQALADELRKRGVPADAVELGVAYFYTQQGKIGRDDAGKIVWLTDDELDPHKTLADGVEEVLGTDAGKRLLPPTQARGTGTRTAGRQPAAGKGDKGEYSDADLSQLLSQYRAE